MSLILCHMTRVVNVSTICFKSILLKRTFKETDEFNEDDDDDADERERDT